MIERMEAMMQAQASVAPRILSPEEAVAEELRRRHGERALLIEARTGGDGRVRLLVVLDLDGEALAAEAKRHEARREVGPAVEVIDRPTWLAMRRLAASGMITLAEGSSRVLHQLPDFAAAADPSYDPEKRSIELRSEAERSLAHGARSRGRWFPRGGAAAYRQGDRHRCGGEARGARRTPCRSLDSDAQLRYATWSTVAPLLRRRRPRCRHCGPLPEDVSSATLFRSSIMRPSPSPESMTENGPRPP